MISVCAHCSEKVKINFLKIYVDNLKENSYSIEFEKMDGSLITVFLPEEIWNLLRDGYYKNKDDLELE